MSQARDAGCALEFVHCFSLIHDDLPAIDNDDYRRGRPTCHKRFGEAMAILAGDALFALAFQTLASIPAPAEAIRDSIQELALAAGSAGLVGGEVMDVLAENTSPSKPEVLAIHGRKTGALLAASCAIGGIMARASDEQVRRLDANNVELYLARASTHIGMKQFEQALEDRERAVALRPDYAEAYVARGGSYHLLGQHEKGLADRSEAIRLKPGMPEAWHARGSAYYLLGEYEKAAEDLQEAVRLNLNYTEAREVLAHARRKIEEKREASQRSPEAEAPAAAAVAEPTPEPSELAPAIVSPQPEPESARAPQPSPDPKPARDPKLAEAHHKAGRQHMQEGRYEQAESELSQAISLDPRHVLALNARGFSRLQRRRYEEALQDFEAALAVRPDYGNALQNRNAALRALRRPVEHSAPKPAAATPATTARRNMSEAEALHARGRELMQKGDFEQAIRALSDAIALHPGHALAFNARGYCYMARRKYKEAIADFDEAIRLRPGYENAMANRAAAVKLVEKK